jgi:hypothetical protein
VDGGRRDRQTARNAATAGKGGNRSDYHGDLGKMQRRRLQRLPATRSIALCIPIAENLPLPSWVARVSRTGKDRFPAGSARQDEEYPQVSDRPDGARTTPASQHVLLKANACDATANFGNCTARRSDTRASPLGRGGPLSRVCREGRWLRPPGAVEEMTIEPL